MGTQEDVLKDLVGLPEAAQLLGVHRATANDMVKSGRLTGYRLGPHWYVRRSDLEIFARHYERPKNSPRRKVAGATAAYWTNDILRWLGMWESATSEELRRVIDLHVGNIRKYLSLAELDGLVTRDENGFWSLTSHGRERAATLPAAGPVPADA
jgi:excisionase family DNA binding protein